MSKKSNSFLASIMRRHGKQNQVRLLLADGSEMTGKPGSFIEDVVSITNEDGVFYIPLDRIVRIQTMGKGLFESRKERKT